MMGGMWSPPPVTLTVRAPARPSPDRLRDAYFADVGRLTLGTVRGEPWRLRLGPVTVLAFGEPRFDGWGWSWPIVGGLLARHAGGTLRYAWRDGQLVGTVAGYLPRLPRAVYRLLLVPGRRLRPPRCRVGRRGTLPPHG